MKNFLTHVLFLLFTLTAFGQQSIKGKVVDEDGTPIPAAVISAFNESQQFVKAAEI